MARAKQPRQDIVQELTNAAGGRQEALEHVWWLAASGHLLAERLMTLHVDEILGAFKDEVGDVEQFNTAYIRAGGPTCWLPLWGRSFLFDSSDDLGSVLGLMLSISFRDLWALWDSSGVHENATCRLVMLHDLWGAWETDSRQIVAREAKLLVDRMGDHLRLADASLTDCQRVALEMKRRRFWCTVQQPDLVQHHIKSLELWAKASAPRAVKKNGDNYKGAPRGD